MRFRRRIAPLQRHGFYVPGTGVVEPGDLDLASDGAPIVLVVFYRAILAASDTAPIDRLIGELARCGIRPIGLFAASLKDPKATAGCGTGSRRSRPT